MKDTKVIGFKAGESEARRAVIAPDSAASISRANIVYGVSEGEIEGFVEQLRSVILDNTPVQSSSGDINLPDVEVQTRWGTNDQTHLEGFPAVVNEVGYSGVEIVSDYTFIHYINDLNVDAARIRLQWGKIFKSNPDNGDMGGYRIDYAIDVQTDGAGFVEMIRSALDDKTSSGYERTHQIQLPEAEEGWEIRIRRLTPNTNVEHIGDKMYIRAVGEIIDLKLRYPNTAIIGLKFNAERFTNIPKADFRLKGKKIKVPANYDPVARTYATVGEGTTGGVWNGVFKTAYSNNPAWIFYDIMLSPRYGLGSRIDASMVNKWALYGIARHCDTMVPDGQGGMEPRFACNVYLSSQFEAFDCITQLASVFRGLMHWDGSAIVVHPDTPEDPTFTYTRANIVGDFVYSGTRARDRHSIFTVAFDDPRNNYKTEKEVVSDTNAIAELGVRIGNLSAFGCTSRGQAQRVGRAALLKEQNETRMVNFAVGLDGFIPVTGKIIEIADNILAGRAIGGRIAHVSADLKVVSLDRKIEAQAGDRLAVNNEEGIQESREILSVAGAVVTVTSPFTSLAAENVWALETEDLDLMRFRVLSVTENKGEDGSLNFTISAIQHNKDTQEIADNSSHFEAPIFSKIEIYTQVPVESLTIASENIINQGIDLTNVVISWPQAKGAVRYELEWRRDKGSWIKTPDQYGNEFTIENVYHGNYAARIVAVNAIDVKSLPTLSPITPINSKFTEPAVLASFTATGSQFGMIFNWSFPNTGAENAAQTEIRVAYLSDYSDEKLLGNYAYPLNRAELSGLHGNLKIYAKARIIDRNGVEGAWTPWIFGTTLADPDVLLDVLNGHVGLSAIDEELAEKLELGQEALDEAILAKQLADNAALAASNAATAASTAQASASAAQTTANTAKADALAANTKATANATALTQEVTDRKAAVTAETNARNTAITAEATARATALTKEATDRAAAITAESNTLKADSAAKVKALKDEVDPKIVTLQNGITQITTDYKAADTVVVGQLNAYKTSNNSAVASVLQKAESAVSTGSTNSSAISAINGQITTIYGALSTKLDASVIAGYYTKGHTEAKAAEIAAGKVEEFNASLSIGLDNLLPTQIELWEDGYRHVTNGSAISNSALSRTKAHVKIPVTAGEQYSLRSNARTVLVFFSAENTPTGFYESGTGVPPTTAQVLTIPANTTYARASLFADGGALSKPVPFDQAALTAFQGMLVKGKHTRLIWQPSALGSSNQINANSTAIQNTNAEVTRVDGVATAANNATTALAGRVATVEGSVATKAEAAALTALTTRVSSAEGVNTSQGSAITTLENSVNHATTGLASKASSSALTAVDNKVTSANGRIDTTNSNVTNLTGRVSTVEGAVSTKAEAAALTSLTTRVTNAEGINTSQGTAITSLQNTINHATTGLSTKASTTALNTTNSEVSRVNGVVVAQGTQLTQLTSDISTINGTLATKADATALNSLTTRVDNAEGVNTAQGTSITNLNSSLVTTNNNVTAAQTAATNAMNAAGEKGKVLFASTAPAVADRLPQNLWIDTTGGTNTPKRWNGTAWVVVTDKVATDALAAANAATTALATKADASAVTSLTTRVTAAEGVNTTQATSITNLQNSLVTTNNNLATKADASALNTLDSKVTLIDGKVTSNTNSLLSLGSRMTTVEGTVATKLDASVISNYYTKVQADTVIAGKIEQFNAALKVGSVNLLAQTKWRTPEFSTVNTANGYEFSLVKSVSPFTVWAQYGVWSLTEIPEGSPVVFSFKIKALDSTPLSIGGHTTGIAPNANKVFLDGSLVVGSTFSGGTSIVIPNDGNFHKVTVFLTKSAVTSDSLYIQPNRATSYSQSVNCVIREVMLSIGNVDVDWVPPAEYTQGQLSANSSAINTTNTEVTRVNGVVVAHGTQLTALSSSISTINGTLATKADSSALTSLTNRVTAAEGVNTSQGTSITSLNNSVASINSTLATKAEASALTTLTSRVTAAEGVNTSQGASITSLNNNLTVTTTTANAALPKITGNSSYKVFRNVLNYTSPASSIIGNMVIQTPITFTARMFKITGSGYNYVADKTDISFTIGAYAYSGSGFNNRSAVNTGSMPLRLRLGVRNGCVCLIISPLNSTLAYPKLNLDAEIGFTVPPDSWADGWTLDVVPEADLASYGITGINEPSMLDMGTEIQANSSALTTLDSKVTQQGTTITSNSNSITNLNNSISAINGTLGTKADASALSALTTRVTNAEGVNTSQGTSITNLNNSITTINGTLSSKADSSALTTLASRVTTAEGKIDNQASQVTNLTTSVTNALDSVTVSDTRNTNQPPSWYLATYPKRVVNEFKTLTAIGVGGFFGGTYCNLETKVYYPDLSGGHIIQTATSSVDPSLYVQRTSTSTTAWTAWAQPLKDIRDGLDLKASASAHNALAVRVTNAEGVNTAQANSITSLNSAIANKADASAVTSLTTRVSNAEGVNTSQATQLTNLTSTVNGHTTSIQTQTQVTDGIQAKFTVKINNNGYATGFGLISTNNNAVPSSAFLVDADAFAVGKAGAGTKPFVVVTAGQTIEGITYPAGGTYINSAKIADLTVTSAKIADLGVTTAKIANLAVDGAKIADAAITTAKIGEAQITTAKIGDLQVDTIKVKDNAVTNGIASQNSTSLTIVTEGGQVRVNVGITHYASSTTYKFTNTLILYRDGIELKRWTFTGYWNSVDYKWEILLNQELPMVVDIVSAGTHTYSLNGLGTTSLALLEVKK